MIAKFDPGPVRPANDYPTSDGKPMAETDVHRDLMADTIAALKAWYAARNDVYVSGNLLLFYHPGNKRRHVSPDVFVVFGVPKGDRENYLLWEEGKGPDVVIELTSKTTRREDQTKKAKLYRDTLGVKEYFLFDPKGDYLDPPLQGYRRVGDEFRRIRPVDGRLPSKLLKLHLEPGYRTVRLWDPEARVLLLTPAEQVAEANRKIGEAFVRESAAIARERAKDEENDRLRREVEELRRRLGDA